VNTRQDGLSTAEVRHPSTLRSPESDRHSRRPVRLLVGAVLATVLVVTALLAFGLRRDPNAIDAALIGRQAPNFSLRTLDGSETVSLEDFRGQVVVVNFWASWCDPCRDEHDALAAAWDRYRDRGVVIVGVLYNDTTSNGAAFFEELGGDWPLVDDPKSRTALDFGVYGVPETFFIAPDGRVAHRHLGAVTYPMLSDRISALLREARR
jgi:cytochrome c biogenesis protein CcmG/thiol:disulfide interchange protein DsbE